MKKRVEESECAIREPGCSGQGWISNGPKCSATTSVFQYRVPIPKLLLPDHFPDLML